VAGTNAWTRAKEQVSQLCRGDADARTLRLEVLAVLRRVIGFDAYVWVVTDPETSVGSAPLADVPCLPELPRLIRLKYLTTVNRWTSMTAPVAALRPATGGDLDRSLMWRDLLGHVVAGASTRDVAGLMFVSEHTVQDHLKSIFAKTGTHTRRALLARVLGT
jgi:hypothetical protein